MNQISPGGTMLFYQIFKKIEIFKKIWSFQIPENENCPHNFQSRTWSFEIHLVTSKSSFYLSFDQIFKVLLQNKLHEKLTIIYLLWILQ